MIWIRLCKFCFSSWHYQASRFQLLGRTGNSCKVVGWGMSLIASIRIRSLNLHFDALARFRLEVFQNLVFCPYIGLFLNLNTFFASICLNIQNSFERKSYFEWVDGWLQLLGDNFNLKLFAQIWLCLHSQRCWLRLCFAFDPLLWFSLIFLLLTIS